MLQQPAGKGFVVICDAVGILEQVIQNDYELSRDFSAGSSITGIFDEACLEKVLLFLDAARSKTSVFDWELVISLTSGPATLHCSAVHLNEKLIFVGASSRASAIQVIEEMLKINNEQTNHLRILMKDLQIASAQLKVRDETLYDQMTHLNNELSVMQRELMKKNHELAHLNQQKNYFLGMAAHDLRSPLGTIVSYSEFLLDQERVHTAEDDHNLVAVIKKSSEFMLGIINDLLDISKIESGNLNLKLLPLKLKELISDCLESYRVLAIKKGIKILEVHDGTLPETVVWDRSKIEQVLNNLVGNAIKFSHPDSIVILRLSSDEHLLVMQIEDQGDGMPVEILEQLFIPFSTASRVGTHGEKGTGLGLAIARRMVEGHAGSIRAENIPEGGTRMIVKLPVGGH
ncbi:MAG TPA: HAMP domain-containing histidine kinase [Desulfuromonadales bacterium]|nr:HAMP domain-containing histidine kinase [Desulfuromonadales bacterium]